MNAAGTKLLIVRAKKVTDRNGVAIPDSAQVNSAFGVVLSVGPQCTMAALDHVKEHRDVIMFNPLQTVDSEFEDKAGRVRIEALDEESVFGWMSRAEAEEFFGVEFPAIPEDCPV